MPWETWISQSWQKEQKFYIPKLFVSICLGTPVTEKAVSANSLRRLMWRDKKYVEASVQTWTNLKQPKGRMQIASICQRSLGWGPRLDSCWALNVWWLKLLVFFLRFIYFLYVSTLYLSSDTLEEGIRSHYRCLWDTMWLLGIELRTSGKGVSAFNHWVISQAPSCVIFKNNSFY